MIRALRRWLPLAVGLGLAAAFLVFGSYSSPHPAPRLASNVSTTLASGMIASVRDGDTLRLVDNRRVRLAQVDAPEAKGGDCYGEEAANELERLVPVGSLVQLRTDPKLDQEDRFGRILAYVFRDGENVNIRLVEAGAAAPYFYRGERGRFAARLLAAARKARADRRGLWGACPGTRLAPGRALDARP